MKVQIIVGSTRPGRATDRAAQWVAKTAVSSDAEYEVVDLRDYPLSFFDEPISPQYNPDRQASPETQKWLDKVSEADAYVIVTPEYNRSIPAILKNALDHLAFQMAHKPITVVSHGGNGGTQAHATLKLIIPQIQAVNIPANVYINGMAGMVFSEDGELNDELKSNPYGPQGALEGALKQLTQYAEALKPLRS